MAYQKIRLCNYELDPMIAQNAYFVICYSNSLKQVLTLIRLRKPKRFENPS
jgi:hypothetical protein